MQADAFSSNLAWIKCPCDVTKLFPFRQGLSPNMQCDILLIHANFNTSQHFNDLQLLQMKVGKGPYFIQRKITQGSSSLI